MSRKATDCGWIFTKVPRGREAFCRVTRSPAEMASVRNICTAWRV